MSFSEIKKLLHSNPDLHNALASHLPEPFDVRLLHNGFFSRSWLLQSADSKLVLRHRPQAPVGVDSLVERQVLLTVDGQPFAPQMLFHNDLFWLYRFVEGRQLNGMQVREPEYLALVGETMHGLHQIRVPDLPPLRLQESFADLEKKVPALSEAMLRLQGMAHDALSVLHIDDSLCHHDIWADNLVFAPAQPCVVLLDWEYARRGDAVFDLANFIQYHSLTTQQIELLLDSAGYSKTPSRLLPLRHLAEYLRCLWYQVYSA